jgi:hypothetical protein
LQKLLNKPCSHPDFIKPFKIEVKDQLSDGNGDGLDINKMIDGVLNMCFSVVTSDDTPKPSAQMTNTANASTNKDNTGLDDDITEILELPNSRPNSRGQTRPTQTQTQSQLPTKVLLATIGNTQTTAQHTYDYYNQNPQLKQMLTANPMSAVSKPPPLTRAYALNTNTISNTSIHLQNMSNSLTNSVTQNGIPVNTANFAQQMSGYGSPAVYRGPVPGLQSCQMVQNVATPPNYMSIVTMANPPNVAITQSYNPTTNANAIQTANTYG